MQRLMQVYTLQIYEKTTDDFGYPIEKWNDIASIEVAISETHKNHVSNEGVNYSVKIVNGLTRYADLASDAVYRLKSLPHIYLIDSFIKSTRHTQLVLKETTGKKEVTLLDGSQLLNGSLTLDGVSVAENVGGE